MERATGGTGAGSAAQKLHEVLRQTGLTQSALATALGTSQPRLSTYLSGKVSPSAAFFVRAGQLGQALDGLARLHVLSAPALGLALRSALSHADESWAFRLLMQGRDHLQLVLTHHSDLTAGWIAAPVATGRVEWDTVAAGVIGHEFERAGLDQPSWTRRDPLSERWSFPSALLGPDEVRAATPDWLARLNVFVPARDLVTA